MSSIKRWDGSTWVEHTFKVWNGSSWAAAQAKVWNGSAWVDVPPDVVTTVFDVMDYGAVADGTTDDSGGHRGRFPVPRTPTRRAATHSKVLFPPGAPTSSPTRAAGTCPPIRTDDWVGATPTVQRSGIITALRATGPRSSTRTGPGASAGSRRGTRPTATRSTRRTAISSSRASPSTTTTASLPVTPGPCSGFLPTTTPTT